MHGVLADMQVFIDTTHIYGILKTGPDMFLVFNIHMNIFCKCDHGIHISYVCFNNMHDLSFAVPETCYLLII